MLYEYLVVQCDVLDGDVAEAHIVERGGAGMGNALADHKGLAGVRTGLGLSRAQGAAGIVMAFERIGRLLRFRFFAEAVVGVSALHQQSGIPAVQAAAFRLDVGTHGAAHVGTLVPVQAALAQGAVDDLGGALHQTALVGVLDAQKELAAAVAGDEPGVQGGAQIAHMHITGGGGGETGAHLPMGDTCFHVLKPFHIHRKNSFFNVCPTILFF